MGLDRSTLLRELGVTVATLPLEIHPEIPVGGLSLEERWGRHYGEAVVMYERIEQECEAAGLPFHRPARVPNTRRALATVEWARKHAPEVVVELERSVFEAHFVDNRALDDPAVIDEVVAGVGADAVEARRAVEGNEVDPAVEAAWQAARSLGITATPTWLLGGRLIVAGARPRDVFRSAVSQLTAGEPS